MLSSLDILFLRRPVLNYVCPPICEVSFSNSSGPVIILDPLSRPGPPSGFVVSGSGKFRLSWNSYPGALCFSVYKAVDELDPFGAYVLVAECVTDDFVDDLDPGVYRVTVITEDGESDPGPPVTVGVVGPATTVSVVATGPIAQEDPQNGKFTLIREGSLAGNIIVHFTLGGTAVSGIDYEPIETAVEIPDSIGFVDIDVIPISDPDIQGDRTVILTISPSVNYVIGSPAQATVTIMDAVIVTVTADPDVTSVAGGDPGRFIINRTGLLAGDLTVNFMMSGSAANGTDYTLIPSLVTILDGEEDAFVFIDPLTTGPSEAVLSLTAGEGYEIGSPGEATVTISPCPAEVGPATPDDNPPVAVDTFIATTVFESSPISEWVSDFGVQPFGKYKVRYTGGASSVAAGTLWFVFESNDGMGLRIYADGVFITSSINFCERPSQAATEACFGIGTEFLNLIGSDIQLRVGLFNIQPVADGSPNATFDLYSTSTPGSDLLVRPLNLRIVAYAPSLWVPAQCADMSTGSGDPEWTGTFKRTSDGYLDHVWTIFPTSATTVNDVSTTLDTSISYVTTHPTSANGNGWRMDIAYLNNSFDSVIGWRGYKGVGNSPVGRYYRDSGCQTGPDCIDVETF